MNFSFFQDLLLTTFTTREWAALERTVEDSPWHREPNVADHTLMALDYYINERLRLASRSDMQKLLTATALLFHDFGKPAAEETLTRPDGSPYRRYAGHEPISANAMLDMVLGHQGVGQTFNAAFGNETEEALRKIKVMIQHHLPYGIKVKQKLIDLKSGLLATLGEDGLEAYFDMLLADCHGRISDDHADKIAAVKDWIANFKAVEVPPARGRVGAPLMYVLIGVAGAGKSTYVEGLRKKHTDLQVISEDTIRLEYVQTIFNEADWNDWVLMSETQQYDAAWKYTVENDAAFRKYFDARVVEVFNSQCTIVVDRTNRTLKTRRKFITMARQRHYKVVSVEFFVPLQVLINRQTTRQDKAVPAGVVTRFFYEMSSPLLGSEVDEAIVIVQKHK